MYDSRGEGMRSTTKLLANEDFRNSRRRQRLCLHVYSISQQCHLMLDLFHPLLQMDQFLEQRFRVLERSFIWSWKKVTVFLELFIVIVEATGKSCSTFPAIRKNDIGLLHNFLCPPVLVQHVPVTCFNSRGSYQLVILIELAKKKL